MRGGPELLAAEVEVAWQPATWEDDLSSWFEAHRRQRAEARAESEQEEEARE